ncbi:SDR family NAD(P)-dependent oxidoreductase [Cryptosporangium aurantiacum]|uniref:NAD(P)-dependent dehydrogenase, short-chain alcohol dehydrogenase family n=1 Tax=Cryptosporangium aurantiacum TaxID=134849 RepID=A0A1M7M8P9_9ACTN|nr:SDR family oxidoreductase [Cryptosporangium aurantiacum]SHM87057.1 NAD(P)-dependent dehydrogenase, short-chain alcohol dehydrogenase family [Cryptosporangium aurantiacum]
MSKIALVTGANRGLGRNTALRLAEDGVDLILTYRTNAQEAQDVVDEVTKLGRTAVALRLDVGVLADHAAFVAQVRTALAEQWGRDTFDYLVNNAGVGLAGSFAETTVEVFDELLNVHFRGLFFLTQQLLPVLADGGRIVNISTGLTRFTRPGYAAYAAMKGAVEVLTHYLAKELGPRGITANVVAPGVTATDFGGGVVRDTPGLREHLGSENALGRIGEPDDVGGVIASLLGDRNAFVTNQRLEVSGGTLI